MLRWLVGREPNLSTHRCNQRVRNAQGRRKGQGTEGRGQRRHLLRSRRARLRDPREHRRGGVHAHSRPQNFRYTQATGLPGCARRSPRILRRDSGLEVDPSQVLVTNGGKQSVYQAFQTILDPGDEVIVPTPYWTTYPEAIGLTGAKQVDVFAGSDQGYLVTVDQLEAARTPQTKALLVCARPRTRPVSSTQPSRSRDRPVGARARPLGHRRRDLPDTSPTTASVHLGHRRRSPSSLTAPCC